MSATVETRRSPGAPPSDLHTAERTPQPPARAARAWVSRHAEAVAYGVAGLVMGAVWALGGDTPPAEHALRVLAVLAVAAPVMILNGRRRARAGTARDKRLVLSLLAAKVLLVAVALLLDRILGAWLPEPSLVTAGCLFVLVAAGGPALHARLSGHGHAPPPAAGGHRPESAESARSVEPARSAA
ncbi:hypothetical protein [Streptomyces sp. H27-H5]|uniref:hypothetical protein n=1 Tax=Streptomyces sp. H27-H5 TaxID=2996460 RepID=UPI00226F930D|nr:hypothetical protein [Streptomyces sp. H27-H5]MCY0955509.1 hypothetical protein [Streptomyces sp. H27-H5]